MVVVVVAVVVVVVLTVTPVQNIDSAVTGAGSKHLSKNNTSGENIKPDKKTNKTNKQTNKQNPDTHHG